MRREIEMMHDADFAASILMWLPIIGATIAVMALAVTAWVLWRMRTEACQRLAIGENNLASEMLLLSPNAVRLLTQALARFPAWPWDKALLAQIKQQVSDLKSS